MNRIMLGVVVLILAINGLATSQECPGNKWTKFYDRDYPTGTGDYETLLDLRKENPGEICESPTAIDARLLNGLPFTYGGDHVTVHESQGLWCRNKLQGNGYCSDYKVRFCCPDRKCKWTQWFDRDNASGTGDWELLSDLDDENPFQICSNPVAVDGEVVSGSGNDAITMTPSRGIVCENADQSNKYCKDYKVRFLCCE